MTDAELRELLPTRQSALVRQHTRADQLGGEFIIYRRESVQVGPEPTMYEDYEGYIERMKKTKRHWGAYCTCTACGESFVTGWADGGPKMIFGDDGTVYEGFPDGTEDGTVMLEEGDSINCPICFAECKLIKASSLRYGRTFQMLYTTIDNLCGHIAIITYLASRHLNEFGWEAMDIQPRDAAVLMPDGNLRCWTRSTKGVYANQEVFGDWQRRKKPADPMQRIYYSYDAIRGRQFGSVLIPDAPSVPEGFEHTTAEKTGLYDYLRAGGKWPFVYLRFRRQHKNVENLLKSGFHRLIVDEIDGKVNRAAEYGQVPGTARDALLCVDWRKAKPHEMLGMTKAEYQAAQNYNWTDERLLEWQSYSTYVERMSPEDFAMDIDILGEQNVMQLADDAICGESDLTLSEVHKYARKQKGHEPEYAARLLIDYRRMLTETAGVRQFTIEELYPRDIMQAHDRLTKIIESRKDTKLDENFRRVKEEYGALEWTDGELCIIIPDSNEALVQEGKTLRHCVGSYGRAHLEGRMIFFVRHYRRQERSYYTLNENLTGERPFRVQLHGYGNERHGEHKQYSHSIPKKVTDFVDRWEKEILAPWHARHQAEKNNKKKKEKAA